MLLAAARLDATPGRHAAGGRKAAARGTIEMSAVSARHFAIVATYTLRTRVAADVKVLEATDCKTRERGPLCVLVAGYTRRVSKYAAPTQAGRACCPVLRPLERAAARRPAVPAPHETNWFWKSLP